MYDFLSIDTTELEKLVNNANATIKFSMEDNLVRKAIVSIPKGNYSDVTPYWEKKYDEVSFTGKNIKDLIYKVSINDQEKCLAGEDNQDDSMIENLLYAGYKVIIDKSLDNENLIFTIHPKRSGMVLSTDGVYQAKCGVKEKINVLLQNAEEFAVGRYKIVTPADESTK